MGLLKNFFSQTKKPEGFLGKLMVNGMNSGHAKLGDWGMERLPRTQVKQAADFGCGGGRNVEKLLERYPEACVTCWVTLSFPCRLQRNTTRTQWQRADAGSSGRMFPI